jgi:hypothetical protein
VEALENKTALKRKGNTHMKKAFHLDKTSKTRLRNIKDWAEWQMLAKIAPEMIPSSWIYGQIFR